MVFRQYPFEVPIITTGTIDHRMRRSPLAILFITVVIDLLGFGMVLPLLPLYVDKFGGRPVAAGLMATSYSVMQFLFAPIWGRASDLLGRRPLILLSLLGSALSFFLFGVAQALWVLFAARIAAGILTAASLPTAHAYIADVTPPEKRSRGMAMIGVAFGIGFSCGPMLGGWLGRHYGLSVPAFAVAAMALANFAWSFFALPESRSGRGRAEERRIRLLDSRMMGEVLRTPGLGKLVAMSTVVTFGMAVMESTFTWLVLLRFVEPTLGPGTVHSILEREAAGAASRVFAIVGITSVIAQGMVMGGMAQRLGERRLVWIGAVVLAASFYGIGAARTFGQLEVLSAAMAVGAAILSPVLTALITHLTHEEKRGGVLGVQQGLSSMARMTAPPLGAYLLQRFGTGTPYLVAGSLMSAAAVMGLRIPEPQRHTTQTETAESA